MSAHHGEPHRADSLWPNMGGPTSTASWWLASCLEAGMPPPRRPHPASPDEVKITREWDCAIITYADDAVGTTSFKLGRDQLQRLSDAEILTLWNEHIEMRDELALHHDHVAIEVPAGKPQVDYAPEANRWVPRADVLRCVVLGAADDPSAPFISIDGRDFSALDFAKMVAVFSGWGMRIVFVPDAELHHEPVVDVRDPGPRR